MKTITKKIIKKETVHPSIIACWAAVVAVSYMIPVIPLIGTGGSFSVSMALIPLSGIFFGPFYGALCAAIAGVIGQIVAPYVAWLGVFTFTIATINAFVAGLVSRGKWLYGMLVLAFGTVLWFLLPVGRAVPQLAFIFYGAGFVSIILGGVFSKKWLAQNKMLQGVAVFLCAFSGYASSASIANALSVILFKRPEEIWRVLAFLSPVERVLFALGTAIVGVPLLTLLPKIGIFVGPEEDVNIG